MNAATKKWIAEKRALAGRLRHASERPKLDVDPRLLADAAEWIETLERDLDRIKAAVG